jgi:hypothetical protein
MLAVILAVAQLVCLMQPYDTEDEGPLPPPVPGAPGSAPAAKCRGLGPSSIEPFAASAADGNIVGLFELIQLLTGTSPQTPKQAPRPVCQDEPSAQALSALVQAAEGAEPAKAGKPDAKARKLAERALKRVFKAQPLPELARVDALGKPKKVVNESGVSLGTELRVVLVLRLQPGPVCVQVMSDLRNSLRHEDRDEPEYLKLDEIRGSRLWTWTNKSGKDFRDGLVGSLVPCPR